MLAAVADTHTAIWYLFGSDALSEIAKQTIEKAAKDGFYVGVSALSLAEIVYTKRKTTYFIRNVETAHRHIGKSRSSANRNTFRQSNSKIHARYSSRRYTRFT